MSTSGSSTIHGRRPAHGILVGARAPTARLGVGAGDDTPASEPATPAESSQAASERSGVDDGRRFVVCRSSRGATGPQFHGLSRGFASFEQALAACPTIAQDSGLDLDEVVIVEVHEFWECF